MDTFDFFKSDWEVVCNIVSILSVVSKLVVVVPLELFFWNTVFKVECPAFFSPAFKSFIFCSWFTEIFHFHLFKFTGTENKVFEDDFVAERFTNLSYTERNLHAVRLNDILEVCKDTLTSFWAKVDKVTFVSDWTLVCFEHKVEFANGCIFAFFASASRTVDVGINISLHFFVAHCINWFRRSFVWI